MPLKTVIIEDEAPARERLKSLLSAFEDIDLVGEASDGPDGVVLIDDLKPDLAFLDIQLPVFTGFEVLEKIRHHPLIVFITAFDDYAIKAFEANAVDYLLKPTTPERLREAIDRVLRRPPQALDMLLGALKSALQKPAYQERFPVKIGNEILFIPAEDVCWFHADDKYVFLHTAQEEYLLEISLKNLESRLNPESFIRIHKSVIINNKKMVRIKRDFSGRYKVQLNDLKQSAFEIGRTYLTMVRERLGF
jgi:two-component system LytT family response regulator